MTKECPICHKKLASCVTGLKETFYACFACSYMTEPESLKDTKSYQDWLKSYFELFPEDEYEDEDEEN